MRFDAATAAALATLTEALDEPGTDIVETISRLGEVVAAAVPSFVAMSFRTGSGDAQIEFTGLSDAHEDLSTVRTSLVIPLSHQRDAGSPAASPSALVLYAGQPGAFVDIAADISWITGRPLDSFRIDEHLIPSGDDGSVTALQDASTVNQAVGVLLERGFTMEGARHHLDRLAAMAGVASAAAAAILLGQLSDGDVLG